MLMKPCTALLALHLVIGRVLMVIFLSVLAWPAFGQWALDSKVQLPMGQSQGNWVPLPKDRVHDPRSPSLVELQDPSEGLSELPPHQSGNRVLWGKALDQGAISPRRTINPNPSDEKFEVLDLDVLMDLNGSMDIVRFPHKIHTQWLACNNCHEELFKSKIGTNKISMNYILQGEQCGLCHGSVAFPLTQCQLCHSVERQASKWQLNKAKE